MAIGTDFEIIGTDIRYIGAAHGLVGAGYYTVIEFHRWLQDLADDASASGDDYMDITLPTPSDRSTDNIIALINGYNIDDASAEYLFAGSIIQAGGDVIYDGFAIIANPGTGLIIHQNGAVIANDFWNETPFGAGSPGLNPDPDNGISHRFMLKMRTAGADIDGRRIVTLTRDWGKSYSEFRINGTQRGINVAALNYVDDLNNVTAEATVATYTTITNAQGYVELEIVTGVPAPFYSEWDKDIYSINQFYERTKWLTRTGSVSVLYGLDGDLFRGITHDVTVNTPTGTFDAFEPVSWATGSGQMLAINSPTAGTRIWLQLLTGTAPVAAQVITGGTSGGTAIVTSTVERPVSTPFAGASIGSALLGAYGVGITPLQLTASDRLLDLNNTQRIPPNLVTFTITNLVSGDTVTAFPSTGTVIDTDQLTLDAALSGAAVTSIVVNEVIPTDTPSTGFIRITRTSGVRTRHAYTAYSGSTFTIGSTDFSVDGALINAHVFVGYIDGTAAGASMSFTAVYLADRSLFVRVRRADPATAIKTFESPNAQLGAAGGNVAITRISDL